MAAIGTFAHLGLTKGTLSNFEILDRVNSIERNGTND
jgi:hypothetical protein